MTQPKNIALFCSGSGTNAEKLMEYFSENPVARVACLAANRSDAYALERAKKHGAPTFVFNRSDFYDSNAVLQKLRGFDVDYVVLAGFLWLVPPSLLAAFPGKIINIHPALLPKFGGKGMYGMNVHRAVAEAGETESGITIHTIDEVYDRGDLLFQAKCAVSSDDSPEAIARKVRELEHRHFAPVVEDYIHKNT